MVVAEVAELVDRAREIFQTHGSAFELIEARGSIRTGVRLQLRELPRYSDAAERFLDGISLRDSIGRSSIPDTFETRDRIKRAIADATFAVLNPRS